MGTTQGRPEDAATEQVDAAYRHVVKLIGEIKGEKKQAKFEAELQRIRTEFRRASPAEILSALAELEKKIG